MDWIKLILDSALFVLPAWIVNMSFTIMWKIRKMIGAGDVPLDFGRNLFDNKRILGDHVTWLGFITGIVVGTAIGMIIGRPFYGLLIGLGAYIGNLIGSFIKRRLGMKSGTFFPIMDHVEYVVFTILLLSVFYEINWLIAGTAVILTLVLHPLICVIAYFLGFKEVPW